MLEHHFSIPYKQFLTFTSKSCKTPSCYLQIALASPQSQVVQQERPPTIDPHLQELIHGQISNDHGISFFING